MAMENDLVRADCIEATEFPELSGKYRVHSVPKTMINQSAAIEGALPEEHFVEGILRSVKSAGAGPAGESGL